jgi:iron complex transport system substrate-binding protein
VRVVSLLPAATEIVATLGGVKLLVGITHECDYPESVRRLPRITTTPIDIAQPSGSIDRAVRAAQGAGRPVIGVDLAMLQELKPDLILTQALCEVCAVEAGAVHRLTEAFTPAPRIVSLGATDLGGIWSDIETVGAAIGLEDDAEELVFGLRHRISRLATRPAVEPRPRVICLEWTDPPYLAGHWVPELVSAAGGTDVGATAGTCSVARPWDQITALEPSHVLVMLCGFDVSRARIELQAISDPGARATLAAAPVWILDGNAYTSRAGPRVVNGAERIRAAFEGQPLEGLEPWPER